jgi:hypothetical protein
LPSSIAFQAFPISSFTCVTLDDDIDEEIGCQQCNANSLFLPIFEFINTGFSFNQQNTASVCKLTSSDGLTTAYCSASNGGNRPQLSFSCYQGAFSADKPLKPKVKYLFFCYHAPEYYP